ncbi:MAG: hypothetical protein OXT72_14705 [Gammaproteobacteria bacterium]|nr:hypothetical protein [Gammaproteobacteria bacterium]MDE0247237.1 hypothetical protein [Gammaproteobacteria bacterium]
MPTSSNGSRPAAAQAAAILDPAVMVPEKQGYASFVGVVVHGVHETQISGCNNDTNLFSCLPD